MKGNPIKDLARKRSFLTLFAGFVIGVVFHRYFDMFVQEIWLDLPAVPMQPYPEEDWRQPNTLAVRTVASTPFARFEVHRVRAENGQIIDDWLWEDERSHVNIVVHTKENNKYLVMKQNKYGFRGPKLAVVGGLFSDKDTPEQCATRELLEETGLQAGELVYLGEYRVQANRGGGILHAYLARDCVKSTHSAKPFEQDYEKQEVQFLSREELQTRLLSHEFGEAQHAGVVALALLQEQRDHSHDGMMQ